MPWMPRLGRVEGETFCRCFETAWDRLKTLGEIIQPEMYTLGSSTSKSSHLAIWPSWNEMFCSSSMNRLRHVLFLVFRISCNRDGHFCESFTAWLQWLDRGEKVDWNKTSFCWKSVWYRLIRYWYWSGDWTCQILDSSTSSQNALVVADLVSSSDNGCISNADSDHLLDDNIQQGNIFRRKTPGYCPVENKLAPPRVSPKLPSGRGLNTAPSRQRLEGQTQRTTTTGESPCAGRLYEQKHEHVTCGGPEIGDDPNSIFIDRVVHCVNGKSSQSLIVPYSLIRARPDPNPEMVYRSSDRSASHGPIYQRWHCWTILLQ